MTVSYILKWIFLTLKGANMGSCQVCHTYPGFQGLCALLLVYETQCVPWKPGYKWQTLLDPFFRLDKWLIFLKSPRYTKITMRHWRDECTLGSYVLNFVSKT